MKRMLALILALTMVMALVACGGDKPTSSTPSNPTQSSKPTEPSKPADSGKPTEPSKPTEPEKPAEPKVLNTYTQNDGSLFFGQASGSAYDNTVLTRITAALYGYLPVDGKAALMPILAEEYPIDVNGDGMTWDIKISKDAKWQNGEPINADTYIFTWKTMLDPKMVYPSASGMSGASQIVNAKEYYGQGKEGATPVAWEDVGVKKIDEYTVRLQTVKAADQVTMARALSSKAYYPIYEPLYKECLAADGLSTTYGSTLDKTFGCGPYKLTNWVVGALHEYEKNEYYVHADMVKIDKIREVIVADANTCLQMFEAGEIDNIDLNAEGLAKYEEDPRLLIYPSTINNTIEVMDQSTKNPILGNYNFRLAMYYGINREELVKLYSAVPNISTIPVTAAGMMDGTLYKEVAYANNIYLAQDTAGYDPKLAKELFDKALQEENLTSVEVTFLVTEYYTPAAEYLQQAWAKLFGADRIKVNVDTQPSNAITEARGKWQTDPSSYDLCFLGLSGSSANNNPVAGSSYFNSKRAKRNAPHINDEAAALYTQSYNVLDPAEKYRLAMEYEKALQKTMTAIPVMNDVSACMFADYYVMPIPVENYATAGGWCANYADIVK